MNFSHISVNRYTSCYNALLIIYNIFEGNRESLKAKAASLYKKSAYESVFDCEKNLALLTKLDERVPDFDPEMDIECFVVNDIVSYNFPPNGPPICVLTSLHPPTTKCLITNKKTGVRVDIDLRQFEPISMSGNRESLDAKVKSLCKKHVYIGVCDFRKAPIPEHVHEHIVLLF